MSELKIKGRIDCIDPRLGTHAFNGCVLTAWNRLLAIYRVNRRHSVLAVSELDDRFRPVYTQMLWDFSDQTLIPEDPRAIVRGDRVYVAWTGLNAVNDSAALMCHGGIDRAYNVVWKSPCWHRNIKTAEKNWVPFLRRDKLFCIYEYKPLSIMRYAGGSWFLHHAHEVNWKWKYGEVRGGAPPVWFRNRWYCFFHSSREEYGSAGKVKVYYAGCFIMDAQYNVLAITRQPILAGHVETYSEPWSQGNRISAVFPCGAMLRGDKWIVSYGYMDSELRIATFDQAELDQVMSAA